VNHAGYVFQAPGGSWMQHGSRGRRGRWTRIGAILSIADRRGAAASRPRRNHRRACEAAGPHIIALGVGTWSSDGRDRSAFREAGSRR